jgi:hypothetical protein
MNEETKILADETKNAEQDRDELQESEAETIVGGTEPRPLLPAV